MWRSVLNAFALASIISAELAGSLVVGVLAGQYLDKRWHTGPWLMVAGLFLGLAAGVLGVYRTLTRFFGGKESR
ncbi:MAG: AtpZ/AtpI family protein [Firmicutes bacterium]|nr:AtpZ/AtpI family protein [Bacillota bacterium]